MTNALHVAVACGGTGGHLFPGIAVTDVLRDRGHEVLLLISEKEIDELAVHKRSDLQTAKIPAIGMPRVLSPKIVTFTLKFLTGIAVCRRLFNSFKPNVVLGMGGFTSTGPMLAGRISGIPGFIHESNAVPGKANRLNARIAGRVFVGFSECTSYFPKAAVQVTGTPIRKSLQRHLDRDQIVQTLGLKPDLSTVLIMGGSQGAHGVNEKVLTVLHRFTKRRVQFIHLTGKVDQQRVYEAYQKEGIPSFVTAFYYRMEELYFIANLVVARSGAASLTEFAYFGLPAILIPYPFAAENHQSLNAEIFAKAGAAIVVNESVSEEIIGSLIEQLLNDKDRAHLMSQKMRSLAPSDAAERIADIIEKTCK
ncbi:MAG: undecaprenyldiphospho-muramoylpentapeptide beta-N-acetylglucosaminyltransferase [Verrucomicrobia bacterium]|nr:undecaprenyldiphospho-muramoylpentapeptide beta-N-acetylglucosaminyltransferase [Verrucomicrobiota bacterium]